MAKTAEGIKDDRNGAFGIRCGRFPNLVFRKKVNSNSLFSHIIPDNLDGDPNSGGRKEIICHS